MFFLAPDWLLFTLSTRYYDALLTGSPCQLCSFNIDQYWSNDQYWQGDPVSSVFNAVLTGWPCQYCSFNCYWQGDPVNNSSRCTIDRVTVSITVETAVLTGSPCQWPPSYFNHVGLQTTCCRYWEPTIMSVLYIYKELGLQVLDYNFIHLL